MKNILSLGTVQNEAAGQIGYSLPTSAIESASGQSKTTYFGVTCVILESDPCLGTPATQCL